ncbi:MAG TPA: hypothetical protein DE060_03665 [Lentisphaeria bacterium]|nr:hypothetical protein [Lentisphaeria bacterium]HCG48289.1 hypothetical protein [Lentisphaeria bacterium]
MTCLSCFPAGNITGPRELSNRRAKEAPQCRTCLMKRNSELFYPKKSLAFEKKHFRLYLST